jgi:DUF971 family protein/molybdopterin converting factor small subunit
MSEPAAPLAPTGIRLHQKSRLLEISFSDGSQFMYPCEYLRVLAPAAAGQGPGTPVSGKERVGITHAEPQGDKALLLAFDDGFSGSYSWQALHALGVDYERNWQAYLQALQDNDLTRAADRSTGANGRVTVRLLYFIQLATLTGRDEEEVELPASVTSVETLLVWLGNRKRGWQSAFAADKVQVTVNRHFAEPFTRVEHGDEIAIVPRAMQS